MYGIIFRHQEKAFSVKINCGHTYVYLSIIKLITTMDLVIMISVMNHPDNLKIVVNVLDIWYSIIEKYYQDNILLPYKKRNRETHIEK